MPADLPNQTSRSGESSEDEPLPRREYAALVTPYELEVRAQEHGFTVVGLVGELDLTNAEDVERELVRAVGDDGGIVLDLNGVTFIDSAALHMLFRVARGIGDARRFGIVLEPTALVARTLEIVGLTAVTTVRQSVDELVGEPAP
jgi:anti-sigma B factor antagonist